MTDDLQAFHAIEQAIAEAERETVEKIVAWLRERARYYRKRGHAAKWYATEASAAAIERGDWKERAIGAAGERK